MRFFLISSLISLSMFACGGSSNDAEAYPTLQECYDDHTTVEMLPVTEAITVCCIDHPINGVHPSCGNTQAECETIVRAGLDQSVTTADITTACTDYVTKKGQ